MTAATLPEIALPELPAPEQLADLLSDTGAALIRGAGIGHAAALADLASGLGLVALDQPEPFAPRRNLGHGVWSEPAWPSTSPMCMHHELGWQLQPPPYLLIACLQPPDGGGRTGLADGRAVLSLLPDPMVERAEQLGWALVRRYADGLLGMPWRVAFAGLDEQDVEAYADAEGIELRWEADRLVTRRCRPALRTTGADGLPAWSNLLAFCSEWTMDPKVREYLVSTLGRFSLPFETSFGDGSAFTAEDVEAVNVAYDAAAALVTWSAGDVLVVDNVRTAHSMEPFTGTRAMALMHASPVVPTS